MRDPVNDGQSMRRILSLAGLGLAALLAGCGPAPRPAAAGATGNLAEVAIPVRPGAKPPAAPGECWVTETTPAVIETVTEQELASPEVRDEAGVVVAPASWRSVTRQVMVEDRRAVWIQTPCPTEMTPAFIASLQRALKARGFYLAPLTGTMDAATAEALRRYQASRGFDSAVLTYVAARELGLIATAVEDL